MRSSTYPRIGPHHLAHLRAVADGLDVRACAKRYLGLEDSSEADLAHAELTSRLRAAAKHAGEKHYRLIGLRIRDKQRLSSQPGLGTRLRPSLEDFITQRGLDGWSEAEQLEFYEAEYPPEAGTAAVLDTLRRRERSRQRVVEMLARLERDRSITFRPQPEDDIHAWFAEHIAQRLTRAGLFTLGELATRIRQGGQWFAGIEAVGRTKASQIVQQVEAILPGSTQRSEVFAAFVATGSPAGPTAPSNSSEQHISLPSTALPSPALFQPALRDPADLSEGSGIDAQRMTAYRSDNIGAIGNDTQALRLWVEAAAGSPATRKSYEREGRRLLLWLQIERSGKPLQEFRLDDTQAYKAFLAFIPDAWISRNKVPPGSPDWTPFMGQLSASSQQQAMTVVAAWFDWLVNAEYLRANPWRLIKKAGQSREQTVSVLDTKALSDRAASEIDAFIASQPPTPAQRRAQFIFRFLSRTGLRSTELLTATMGDIRFEKEGVFLQVIGKGAKARDVLLVDSAVSALVDYLQSRGIDALDSAPPETPLFASLEDLRSPVSYQTLYKTTRRWLRRGVLLSDLSAAEKDRLQRASAHWLRHTFGTKAVALGTPLDVVQQQLGHASINTTMSIYSRAPLARRATELQKAWRAPSTDGAATLPSPIGSTARDAGALTG